MRQAADIIAILIAASIFVSIAGCPPHDDARPGPKAAPPPSAAPVTSAGMGAG